MAYDLAIIGGGILGLATGRELLMRHPGLQLAILEKEERVAAHQTTHNSGVIHSGIYYRPGSLRDRFCRPGAQALREYCDAHAIPWRTVGKLIVATEERELGALDGLYQRGTQNGVAGIAMLDQAAIAEREPHCVALRAILVPETAVVDFARVAECMTSEIQAAGGDIITGAAVLDAQRGTDEIALDTTTREFSARCVIACAGLEADGVARALGGAPHPRIQPVRGEFLLLASARRSLVNGCIYPVPNVNLPFLGSHVTPRIDDSVWLGPGDAADPDVLPSVQRFLPDLRAEDVAPGPSGIRAQGVDEHGRFIDDFVFEQQDRILQVRNAPSPAATASIAIARYIADEMQRWLPQRVADP